MSTRWWLVWCWGRTRRSSSSFSWTLRAQRRFLAKWRNFSTLPPRSARPSWIASTWRKRTRSRKSKQSKFVKVCVNSANNIEFCQVSWDAKKDKAKDGRTQGSPVMSFLQSNFTATIHFSRAAISLTPAGFVKSASLWLLFFNLGAKISIQSYLLSLVNTSSIDSIQKNKPLVLIFDQISKWSSFFGGVV